MTEHMASDMMVCLQARLPRRSSSRHRRCLLDPAGLHRRLASFVYVHCSAQRVFVCAAQLLNITGVPLFSAASRTPYASSSWPRAALCFPRTYPLRCLRLVVILTPHASGSYWPAVALHFCNSHEADATTNHLNISEGTNTRMGM